MQLYKISFLFQSHGNINDKKTKVERGAIVFLRLYNKTDFVRALSRLIAYFEERRRDFSKLAIDKA